MKPALKILKWFAIVVAVMLIALAGFSIFLQDKMVTIFISSVNKNISTKIETGRVRFSLISRFPKASVRLENVLVHSSSGFDRTQFKNTSNTDTLLFAKSAVCEFKITDIIKNHYNIENIILNNGCLNLFSDSSGGISYDISSGKSTHNDKDFEITLDKIILSNISLGFYNKATNLTINGVIKNGRIKSRISGNYVALEAASSLILSRLEVFPVFLKTPATASVDINIQKSDSGFLFRKGILKVDNFSFNIAGNISRENWLSLKISGNNLDLSLLKKFLSPEYQKKLYEYDPAGVLKIDAGLTGLTDRTHNPEIKLNFSLEKGHVIYRKSNLKLERISFAGSFTNGKYRRPETSLLVLKRFTATLGSSVYSGTLRAENFIRPVVSLSLSGKVFPSELSEYFNIRELSGSGGSAEMNLKLSGAITLKKKYSMADLLKLHPVAKIRFNAMDLNLDIDSNKIMLKDINGKMDLGRSVRADSISFYFKDQFCIISGNFFDLPAWIAGQKVVLRADCDLSINNFQPEAFVKYSTSGSGQPDFRLPKGVELNVSFNTENLKYRKISADKFSGKLIYRPGLISINALNITSLDGNISGGCFLAQGEKKTFISHGDFKFENVDINKAFTSFNNFGQDFIKAENIAGSLTGKLSLLIPLDSKLNPITKLITAEGKYVISDGTLTNFEPVESLSKFIELPEIENIRFSKLENDFYIKNRYVVIPQMDIKSSASDFTVSGKHGFENDYEYHVKTYLSLLLSKKVKKTKKTSTEFGAVEDDGLGRTSVFLKITGKAENMKVGYDLKAAGSTIRQNFKTEKEGLKSVLNKEYGWYKKDSTIKIETTVKPKFRIEWDENDSTDILTDTTVTNKDRGINSNFRKKKGP